MIDVMNNMHYFMNKLNEMSISNINKHHQKMTDSHFHTLKTPSWDYIYTYIYSKLLIV